MRSKLGLRMSKGNLSKQKADDSRQFCGKENPLRGSAYETSVGLATFWSWPLLWPL